MNRISLPWDSDIVNSLCPCPSAHRHAPAHHLPRRRPQLPNPTSLIATKLRSKYDVSPAQEVEAENEKTTGLDRRRRRPTSPDVLDYYCYRCLLCEFFDPKIRKLDNIRCFKLNQHY